MRLYSLTLALVFGGFPLTLASARGEVNVYSGEVTAEEVQVKRTNYPVRLGELEEFRKKQAAAYAAAGGAQKAAVIRESRAELEKALRQDVFPAWFGTGWDFNGTTTTPGAGKIACGYFVSTCLTHVGFKVSRIKLAQQASQRIIETFMAKSERKILGDAKPMAVVRAYLKGKGDGIYLVGLDQHVGFVSVVGEDMAFIHSSYYNPESCVKAEKIETKNPLSDSKYRVIGKLFADDMVLGWLEERNYPVAGQ